jgi:hypothetical protein
LRDVEEAIYVIDELRDCLNELTAQMSAQAPTNPHSPDVRINDAFMKAMALLVRLDAEDHSSSVASARSSSTALEIIIVQPQAVPFRVNRLGQRDLVGEIL